jgi:hypothetical protein
VQTLTRVLMGATVLCAGMAASADAGVIRYQVRNASNNSGFAQSVQALPGDTIEVRVRIAYDGTTPIFGLNSAYLQPVLAGSFGLAPGSDRLITDPDTFIGPQTGSNNSTPLGSVPGEAGQYGRVGSFGGLYIDVGLGNSPRAFYGSGTTAGLARISQSRVTNWIGRGNGLNNSNGAGGIPIVQLHPGFGATFNPWGNGDDDDGEYVFQFGFIVGEGTDRSISIETGLVYGAVPGSGSGTGRISWYTSPDVVNQSIQTEATTIPGYVQVIPAPGAIGLLAGVALVAARRRRL